MIIAKFGGTSVSSNETISAICQIVENQLKKDPVLVVSALSGVTDLLLSLPNLPKYKYFLKLKELKKLHQDLTDKVFIHENLKREVKQFISGKIAEITALKTSSDKKSLDKLSSFGEIMSSYIIAKALEQKGLKAAPILATNLIITSDNFGSAEFVPDLTIKQINKILVPLIKNKIVPVITGFIGSTKKGQVTTLGRGGSDYSASIIGFSLKASEIQIWTDVDGIFSSDPRLIKKAKLLSVVSFKEAAELAAFGAKVLHPKTIHPAVEAGIPVRVLNTFNPKESGTLIINKTKATKKIKAISFKRKITLVNIYSTEMLLQKGFLARIFEIFSKNNISVDLVSVSEVSVSVTLDNTENLQQVVSELSEFTNTTVSENLGMVSLIGEGITDSTVNIKNIFDVLDKKKILAKMVSLGATNINISIIVKSEEVEKAVKYLHHYLLK